MQLRRLINTSWYSPILKSRLEFLKGNRIVLGIRDVKYNVRYTNSNIALMKCRLSDVIYDKPININYITNLDLTFEEIDTNTNETIMMNGKYENEEYLIFSAFPAPFFNKDIVCFKKE